jgi:hypothetical protein
MKPDRERIPLVLRRTERGLEPRTRQAADLLAEYALHSDVEVSIKKRRSLPQLRLYWAMLQNAVTATNAWPTAEHLHDAIKMDLGYTMPVKQMNGSIVWIPDSAAMGRMDSKEFKTFFDAAAKRLAEACGFDPLAEMEKEAA